jgi:hypothetical protein
MYKWLRAVVFCLVFLQIASCAKDRPYLSGHVRRAFDAALTTCDPYNLGNLHSCVIFSSAFRKSLYVYDATIGEMVLGPNRHFPLKVQVGPSTDELVTVVSENERFPFILALDRALSEYYPVRLFPSNNQESLSFEEPSAKSLPFTSPFKMAALHIDDKIVAVATFPKEQKIAVFAQDAMTAEVDKNLGTLLIDNLAFAPSHVVIDGKTAIISAQGSNNIYLLDLKSILTSFKQKKSPVLKPISIGMQSDQLYLSRRDFGNGLFLYALVFNTQAKEIKLIDIEKEKVLAGMKLDLIPTAAYFPDKNADTCCGGVKNWLSIMSITGKLHYIEIKNEQNIFSLKNASIIDMILESNLALSKVSIIKIIGGTIKSDPAIKRENVCKNNRETFYIASFANSRSYLHSDPVEVEGHGYSCEGEGTASRFGFKAQ